MVPIPMAGPTSRSPGYRSRMRARMRSGPASGFPTSGNGSTPRKVTMAASFPGGTATGSPPHGAAVRLAVLRITNAPAPIPDKGRTMPPPAMWMRIPTEPVHSASWTWSATSGSGPTSIIDDHTRAAILRGGSHYQPQGSIWYFPQAYKNEQHGKLAPDGSQLRPLGSPGIPLCQGRTIVRPSQTKTDLECLRDLGAQKGHILVALLPPIDVVSNATYCYASEFTVRCPKIP